MKRLISLILLWALMLLPNKAFASLLTFAWSEVAEAEGYKLFIALSSLTSYDMKTINGGSTTTTTYDDTGLGDWLFYRLTAFNSTEESENSIELICKYCNGTPCKGEFTATSGDGDILLTWESIPSIGSYLVRLSNDTNPSTQYFDNVPGGPYLISGLSDGDYTVSVFPKNAEGNTIEGTSAEDYGNNVFESQSLSVQNQVSPPPNAPNIWIESFGSGGTAGYLQKLIVAFDESNPDPNTASYRVDVYSSSSLANFGAGGDLINNQVVSLGSNFCRVVDTTNHPMVFITASGRNSSGTSGDTVIGYKLIGNINDTYNDGVAYDSAGFSSGDLNAFRAYYRQPTGEDVSTYCQMANLYDYLSSTYSVYPWKRADYDADGVIGRPDYYFYSRVK